MNTPNPLLKRIEPNDLPQRLQVAYKKSMELRGDATFFEVFGNNPKLFEWYTDRFYQELFYAKHIDQKIKEIIRLKLSKLHGCKFCNQGNTIDAKNAGISKAQIKEIHNPESLLFTDQERAVLQLTELISMNHPNETMSSSLYEKLKVHFDDAAILELGMIMGILTGIAKFIFVFDLVEREDYCPFNLSSDI